MGSYRQYVDELEEHNWDDQAEKTIAMAIASASVYRGDVCRS
jgi:hypothetical protein